MKIVFCKQKLFLCLWLIFFIVIPEGLWADQIGQITELNPLEQIKRFLSFSDSSLKIALTGAILLGGCCGLLGPFLVVCRNSLMGDTLSHAVLPGIVLGFLWGMSKDPIAMTIGAMISGLMGSYCVNKFKSIPPLKSDSSMGLVLSGFYAIGIVLITMIQSVEVSSKSGLDKYLFGQITSLSGNDVLFIFAIVTLSTLILLIFYKELLLTSFDSTFSQTTIKANKIINALLMLLISLTIIISIKAIGIVLVTAMLIIPASSALLVCKSFRNVIILSTGLGMLSAICGTIISFLKNNIPTGPAVVLCAAFLFFILFCMKHRKATIPLPTLTK